MSFKDTKGFSLIEMMVVLAIMGMLATTAKPTFDGMQARARRVEAKVQLPVFVQHMKLYYQDKGSYRVNINALGLGDLKTTHYDIGMMGCCANLTGFTGIQASPRLNTINSNYAIGGVKGWHWCLVYEHKQVTPSSSWVGTSNRGGTLTCDCKSSGANHIYNANSADQDFFVAAVGNIDNDEALDSLVINSRKELYLEVANNDITRTSAPSGNSGLGTSSCALLRTHGGQSTEATHLKKLN